MNCRTSPASGQVRLGDGRMLAYSEHGTPFGEPVMFFHGIPGSRLFRHPDSSIARSLGARIITADRPGFGLSDFKPGRRLLDWPDDVVELADALHIDRFAVAGMSGGGPYVAACAAKIPHRLTAAAIISGFGPMDAPGATNDMVWHLHFLFSMARHSRPMVWLTWWLANATPGRNGERIHSLEVNGLPVSERRVLDNPEVRRMLSENYAEALRNGVRGVAHDTALVARPWGCRLEDITTAIQLWHGNQDVRTPPTMGHYLASVVPECKPVFYSGEGHEVFYNHWREILAALLSFRTSGEAERPWWIDGERLQEHGWDRVNLKSDAGGGELSNTTNDGMTSARTTGPW